MGVLIGIYWAGVFVAIAVLYHRVGFHRVEPDWREFLLSNLPWFGLRSLQIVGWPITLVMWLVTGTPGSPWEARVRDASGREVRRITRVVTEARRSPGRVIEGDAGSHSASTRRAGSDDLDDDQVVSFYD